MLNKMENQNESCLRKNRTAKAKLDVETGSLRQRDETKTFYANSLTQREMESLVAICDTFIPSIDGSEVGHVDDCVAGYFSASASQTGTPDRVARLMSQRLDHPKKWILRVALWLLSTWIGSLVLCGRRSFTGEFPYFRKFCRLPKKQREDILRNWSASYFSLLRMFFRSIKLITALVFFTQVDEKGRNLAWKAIGYNGPTSDDSDIEEELNEKKNQKPEKIFGPLYNGIIDLKSPREAVAKKLTTGRGFRVSTQKRKSNGSSISDPVMTIRCDAVVVGSGSGGGVVAGVLAKAGYKVLVVESGNYYARSKLSLLEGQALDEMYLSGGLLATSDMNVVVLAGSTVGGGSTINWSASIKTPEHVMKEWAEDSKLEMFGSDLYREAMDVVCKRMGVQCEFVEEGFNNEILRKGCEELGLPVKNIPRNAPSHHYCGFCCLGCKKGQKQGTSETWLVDLVESGNGLILPGCEAMEVLYDYEQGKKKKKKATGVAFAFGEEIYVVESKVTVVACGAIRTPHLLKRSGLKNGNIGRNLCLHPVVMAWGWFPEEDKWPENKKKSYEGGIMTAMSSVVNAETQNSYGEMVIQTPALHPGMFSGIIPWTSSKDFKTRMLKFSRTAHIFALSRDNGTGTINSKSCIDYNLNDEDEESLKKGLERVLKILVAAGAEEIGTHNSEGNSLNVKTASAVEIERFVREESSKPLKDLSGQICSAHQMGSCRMGIRPEASAVRPTGETWEVEGLFVADTSVFPTALGVNPMVTVQSIAYCIGLNVLDVLHRKK